MGKKNKRRNRANSTFVTPETEERRDKLSVVRQAIPDAGDMMSQAAAMIRTKPKEASMQEAAEAANTVIDHIYSGAAGNIAQIAAL